MRIALLSMQGNFDKDLGQGVQKYIYNVWQHMLALKSEHTIDKVELGSGNGRRMRELSFTFSSLFHNMNGYDIIHMPAPIAFNPINRGKAITMTTSHEFFFLKEDNPLRLMPEGRVPSYRKLAYDLCIRQLLSSDYMIVDSTLIRDEAISKGYDRNRIFLVNIGVDDEFLDAHMKPKEEGKEFIVGRLGSFGYRKNVAFSIRAFRKIEDNDIRFEIWGKPSGTYDELVKLASGDPRIQFMGFAPKEKLVETYDRFDVYLHPILYTGFEMEILEAQARGIPVIVSKNAQIPEEVKRYAFEADDEDHMAQLIKEFKEDGYDKKRQKVAMEYARSFTWEKTAEGTLNAYRKALGGA